MATKNNPGQFDCYKNAEPDEPLFVLLARDPSAADLVRAWAALREGRVFTAQGYLKAGLRKLEKSNKITSDEKIREAMECADAMDEWRKINRP